jgi:hypothetical protein
VSRTLLPAIPEGFHPLTATADQLEEYGLPPRPNIPLDNLSSTGWGIAMADLKGEDPAGASCEDSTVLHSTIIYGYWAGYWVPVANVGAGKFNFVDSTWTVPGVESHDYTTCGGSTTSVPRVSVWAGLGSSDIIQSGTDSCSTSGAPTYRFWNEDYLAPAIYEGPTITANDQVYTYSEWDGDNQCTFYEENETTGLANAYLDSNCAYRGEHYADFITENVGTSPYLPSFAGFVQAYNNFTDSDGTNYNLTSTNGQEQIITSNCESTGVVNAMPGPISSSDYGFEMNHYTDSPIC